MLYYSEAGISYLEVPDEICLCIYISGCTNRCKKCHYPELQLTNYGYPLSEHFNEIIDLYKSKITCVCFLGEGDCSTQSKNELKAYQNSCSNLGLKTCLYSGRDTQIENWMTNFSYVKIGSYIENFGPLTCKTTNQIMYQNLENGLFIDITYKFWD